jgi:RNA polymerase primary sigma factor
MLKLHKAVGALEQELERAPEDEELAAHMDVTMEAVRKARNAEQKVAALDKPFGEAGDGDATLIDIIPNEQAPRPEAGLVRQDLSSALQQALGQLMVRESEVLMLAFGLDGGEPRPLKEIAERFEVSPERIRQIRDRGLKALRGMMPANAMQVYLN